MGQCGTAKDISSPEEIQKNRAIDKSLREDFKMERNRIKFLMLGAGGCGKSTFLTQMKLMHDPTSLPTAAVVQTKIKMALFGVVSKLFSLVSADRSGLLLSNGQLLALPEGFTSSEPFVALSAAQFGDDPEALSPELGLAGLAPQVVALTQQPFFKEQIAPRLAIIDVGDSAAYLFANAERLLTSNFKVKREDLPFVRTRTVGIHEHKLLYTVREATPQGKGGKKVGDENGHTNGRGEDGAEDGEGAEVLRSPSAVTQRGGIQIPISITDVGGQRLERTKWIHAFTDVTCLLFFASLADYDRMLDEDHSTNAMMESLVLWEELVNSRWFSEKPVVLMLNKKDVLQQKMPHSPLSKCFNEFPDGGSYESALAFIAEKFKQHLPPRKEFICHYSSVIDRQDVRQIFEAIRCAILATSLDSLV